jgi:predicted CoA-binding protein
LFGAKASQEAVAAARKKIVVVGFNMREKKYSFDLIRFRHNN